MAETASEEQLRAAFALCGSKELETIVAQSVTGDLSRVYFEQLEASFRKKVESAGLPEDDVSPWEILLATIGAALDREAEAIKQEAAAVLGDLSKRMMDM